MFSFVLQAINISTKTSPPTPATDVNPFSGEEIIPLSDCKTVREAREKRMGRMTKPAHDFSSAQPADRLPIQVQFGKTFSTCYFREVIIGP